MLVIVFGVLAAVFLIISIVLSVYICKSCRRRKGEFCKHKCDCKTSPRFGYSMQETGLDQSNQPALGKTKLHTDDGTVPFKPLPPELPYDPSYAEIFFESPNTEPISLSSRSGSISSFDGYAEVKRKNTLPNTTTNKEFNRKTTESRNLLDPDTGLVPMNEFDI